LVVTTNVREPADPVATFALTTVVRPTAGCV
jgi:hypothetical protein